LWCSARLLPLLRLKQYIVLFTSVENRTLPKSGLFGQFGFTFPDSRLFGLTETQIDLNRSMSAKACRRHFRAEVSNAEHATAVSRCKDEPVSIRYPVELSARFRRAAASSAMSSIPFPRASFSKERSRLLAEGDGSSISPNASRAWNSYDRYPYLRADASIASSSFRAPTSFPDFALTRASASTASNPATRPTHF
jgi:hypothetical protein